MASIRTFVAVDIAPAVREQAARLAVLLQTVGDGVKWVEPHNLHLTLKFLGDVPQDQVAAVCQTVAGAVQQQPPFSIVLQGAGAFPSLTRPRTLWLAVTEGRESLQQLQKSVESALKKLGFPKEGRRFEPHLTLGRIRQPGPGQPALVQRLQDQRSYDAGRSLVDQVVVYASHLDRSGPSYEALNRTALGASSEPR